MAGNVTETETGAAGRDHRTAISGNVEQKGEWLRRGWTAEAAHKKICGQQAPERLCVGKRVWRESTTRCRRCRTPEVVHESAKAPELHDVAGARSLRRVICPHLTDAVRPIIQGIIDYASDGMVRRVRNRHQFPISCGADSHRMFLVH